METPTPAPTQRDYAIRLAKIVNRILENPECWHQEDWHCGTAHCVMGHAQIDSRKRPLTHTAFKDGRAWLGLSDDDAEWISTPNRTLPEIHAFASAAMAGTTLFNRDGYDRDGYKRDGYDRDGYNRGGYNRLRPLPLD